MGVTDLLVVAPEAWCAALTAFAAMKDGMPWIESVRVAPWEALVAGAEGRDDAERLKRGIFDAWKQDGIDAVLLVGDADTLPVRFMVLDRKTEAAFDTAFYPSDLYYADLARADGSFEDWNARKDGTHAAYIGEVHGESNKSDAIAFDGTELTPEIAVGRWPASTLEEALAIAAKSIAHERAIARARVGPSAPPVEIVACGGWIDNEAAVRRLAEVLSATWEVRTRAYFDPAALPSPDATAQSLREGRAMVFHTGHATADRWEGALAKGALAATEGADRLPLLFSIGCSSAEWCTLPPYQPYIDAAGQAHAGTDRGEAFTAPPPAPAVRQPGPLDTGSIGEASLLRAEGGAVAYIGCDTGSQPCAQTLLAGFCAHMAASPRASVGEAWTAAIRHYVSAERLAELKPTESWYPPSIYFQPMKFVLLGDPTVPLR